ncbi:uncharacterized protein LOC114891730 [Monodon monoceros]|uniref:uncharacterized protein LOC114891730 n=1 Tax=Monodon monoceros TaxID=40151 RepID=UPI0010F8E7FE|nr:uncharacterized protein LOC114891730 [Monodon monoceros]
MLGKGPWDPQFLENTLLPIPSLGAGPAEAGVWRLGWGTGGALRVARVIAFGSRSRGRRARVLRPLCWLRLQRGDHEAPVCGLIACGTFEAVRNRLHVSRLDAVAGSAAACDCGLDSRELSLGSPRGALGCAPSRQASSLREQGPRCFAHGRGGLSGLWSVSVRTYTWLLLLSVALQAGFKEKGRHAGPTGGRCLWNKSAWTCAFQGAVVSWRPSSGKRQKRARAWAPGPPRKAAAAQAEAPSTSVLGLPGAGQAERRRGPKSCARAARGRCGPRLPPRPHRGGPGAVPGHRRAAGFPTCLLPRRFDSEKKDNNPGAFQ